MEAKCFFRNFGQKDYILPFDKSNERMPKQCHRHWISLLKRICNYFLHKRKSVYTLFFFFQCGSVQWKVLPVYFDQVFSVYPIRLLWRSSSSGPQVSCQDSPRLGGRCASGSEAFAACMVGLLPTAFLPGLEYLVILSKSTPFVLIASRSKKLLLWISGNIPAKALLFL